MDAIYDKLEIWKKVTARYLDSTFYTLFMTVITLFALFGDDIRVASFSKNEDDLFYLLSFIALLLFIIEIVLSSLVFPAFFNSFYFWLDFISTVSIIADIKVK